MVSHHGKKTVDNRQVYGGRHLKPRLLVETSIEPRPARRRRDTLRPQARVGRSTGVLPRLSELRDISVVQHARPGASDPGSPGSPRSQCRPAAGAELYRTLSASRFRRAVDVRREGVLDGVRYALPATDRTSDGEGGARYCILCL